MTGPEHYAEAEQILKRVRHPFHPDYGSRAEQISEAAAHATLALAAATVDSRADYRDERSADAWYEALS